MRGANSYVDTCEKRVGQGSQGGGAGGRAGHGPRPRLRLLFTEHVCWCIRAHTVKNMRDRAHHVVVVVAMARGGGRGGGGSRREGRRVGEGGERGRRGAAAVAAVRCARLRRLDG